MKQKTFKQLKDKLWPLLAAYVKKRDGGACGSCGRRVSGKNYHAGHLIPKSVCGVVLGFHPMNVHGQCGNCNIWAGGNGALFGKRISARYGRDVIAELEEIRKKTKNEQWDRRKLVVLIRTIQETPEQYEQVYRTVYNF